LNTAIGAHLKFTLVPFADIGPKFQTLIAGGELPDIACTVTSAYASLLPEFFASSAADLTSYLSGDAVKDYPNLAALPTRSWKTTIYNGKISAVPQQLPPYFWWPWVHQELLDQAGIAKPKTAAEFKEMAVAMTKPQQGLYGLMSQGGFDKAYDVITGYYSSMFGAPNVWGVDANGKFTHQYETQSFKDAVAYTRDLFAAGVFDPDVANLNTTTARLAFTARKSAFAYNALNTDYWTVGKDANPPYRVELLPPFTPDGTGKPTFYFGRPNLGIAILKKAPEERIRMLLRVLDFMAAPFGSEEYLLMYFGAKDVDYNLDDKGNPVPTDASKNHLLPLSSVVRGPDTLYHPTFPGYAALVQGYQKTLAAIGIEDASIGYFSRTWATNGVPMIQPFGDGVTDIITGRRDLSDYDELLKNWRAAGGDASKAEFEQAYTSAT
jgi:putative aldouronate transport system substrate-binding protein